MRVELRDEKTMVVTPESTAELVALLKFSGGTVQVEEPKPFQANVQVLKVERKP